MARRFGFGERQEESETENGKKRFSEGHIDISEKAAKTATEMYPMESPAGAVALRLADLGGVDLSEYADANEGGSE